MILTRAFYLYCLFLLILSSGCSNGPGVNENDLVSNPAIAIHLNSSNFDSLVNNSAEFAFVEVYSSLCGTCNSISWVIDSIAKQLGDSMLVGAINIESDTLWKRFAIQHVPSFMLFRNGKMQCVISYSEIEGSPYDSLMNFLLGVKEGNFRIPQITLLNSTNFDSLVVNPGKVALVEIFSSRSSKWLSSSWVIDSIFKLRGANVFTGGIDIESADTVWKRFSSDSLPRYILFADGKIAGSFSYDNISVSTFDTLVTLIDYVFRGINEPLPQKIVTLDTLKFDSLTNVWNRVSMVEFFSPLCHYCAEMESTMSVISERYSSSAFIGRVNILTDNTLKTKFGIQGVPTFLFMKSGKEIRRIIGAVPEVSLTLVLDSLLSESR